jgi:hypothetical protein
MLMVLGAMAWGAWKYVLEPKLVTAPESSYSAPALVVASNPAVVSLN